MNKKEQTEWVDYLIDLAGYSLNKKDKEYLKYVRAFWSYSKQAS